MRTWFDDAAYAVRRLRQQPGFSLVAIATLVLGLGANTAIFTLIHAVSQVPLPVPRPAELYRLGNTFDCCVNTGLQRDYSLFSHSAFRHLQTALPDFDDLAAFQAVTAVTPMRPPSGGPPVAERAEYVSANYFRMLEVTPAAGRLLRPDDDRPGAPPVMVMSHRTWVERFGADPDVIGRPFLIGGVGVTLVGVAERGFFGETLRANPAGVWLPLGQEPTLRGTTSLLDRPDTDWLYLIGRVPSDPDPAALGARATGALQAWLSGQSFLSDEQRGQIPEQRIVVTSAAGGIQTLGERFNDSLVVLFAMSGLVLLIAAANLANLLLARADRLQAAIRAALGARVGRQVRQSLLEGLVLAVVGCAGAVLVSMLATRTVVGLAFPPTAAVPVDLTPSLPILGFSVALAIATGVAFAAAPAWAAARVHPIEALRGAAREGAERSFVPRGSLVVVQVALSLVLLAGAGLLGRNLHRLEHQPMGFQSADRLVVDVDMPRALAGDGARQQAVYAAMRQRLGQLPGVRGVTYALYSPMGGNNWSSGMSIAGGETRDDDQQSPSWNRVGPDYFETLGTRVLRGRGILDSDTPDAEHVAVVNAAFARQYFTDGQAIGATLGIGDASHAADFRIVGVVEDVKYSGPARPVRPMVFFPVLQLATYDDPTAVQVQARSTLVGAIVLWLAPGTANQALEPEIRRALGAAHPDLAVTAVRPLEDQVAGNFRTSRLMATLARAYGALALALAALGLYGVTAYGVSRRTTEFGVRAALGADSRRIVLHVLGTTAVQALIGLALGLPLAVMAGRALASQLFEVDVLDPVILGVSAAVLLATAALASALPAYRASRVDPTVALRT